jgi:beta-glucanase (GH16 family)
MCRKIFLIIVGLFVMTTVAGCDTNMPFGAILDPGDAVVDQGEGSNTPSPESSVSISGEETPTSTPIPALNPLGVEGDWELKFHDEFDENELDSTRWTTCYWWDYPSCTIKSNNELEIYQPENVSIRDGVLYLTAREQNVVVLEDQEFNYTSGLISSGNSPTDLTEAARFSFRYGFVEVRAKVPKGKGLWPAIWMLPDTRVSTPEIDILEILGDETDRIVMNYHYFSLEGKEARSSGEWVGPDFSEDWHVFGLDWQPDHITWYIDGVERSTFTEAAYIVTQPMYIILNLAVGGNWPGSPDETTPFPSSFEIDYVRVYQHPGVHYLDPIADTSINSSEPEDNFGKDSFMYSDGIPIKRMCLKYDTTELTGQEILSASLRISTTADPGSPSHDIHEIRIMEYLGWDEYEFDYIGRPLFNGKLLGVIDSATWVHTVYEIPLDVEVLKTELGSTLGLYIESSGEDGLDLYTRESVYGGAQLVIYTSTD